MKIISYVGIEGEAIVIERAQDLYPLLDWFQTQLIDRGAEQRYIEIVSRLMDQAEKHGMGNYDDIENIEYP